MNRKVQVIPTERTTAVLDTEAWTFGAEHEWGDWDRRRGTGGCSLDLHDFTMVNSNGIAVDPTGLAYPFGGELQTPPFPEPEALGAQVDHLAAALLPKPVVNYRSNLHIHVRVPGLRGDLKALKRVQSFVHRALPVVLPLIEPLPRPVRQPQDTAAAHKGALKRWARRRRSHQTLLTNARWAAQSKARTLADFYEAEVPRARGLPAWHLQPRMAVNLRQLLQTDTVEFRHFPGSLHGDEVAAAATWCKLFLQFALGNQDLQFLLTMWRQKRLPLPQFQPYVHWMEERYQQTCHDGSVPRAMIAVNIRAILQKDGGQ